MPRTHPATRGFLLTAGCLVVVVGVLLLALLGWFFRTGWPAAPKKATSQSRPRATPALPALNPQCEFTALSGDGCRLWISRKQDRCRIEPGVSSDPNVTICIGSISHPTSDWLVLLPGQRAYFRWSEARCRDLHDKLVGSRLFRAVLDKRFSAPGGGPLSGLPQTMQSIVGFRPGPDFKLIPQARGSDKYQLFDIQITVSKSEPLWKNGIAVTRSSKEQTGTYCPELGVVYSAVSQLHESPIEPSLFALPPGYQELFKDDEGQQLTPILHLREVLPAGFFLQRGGSDFVFNDVEFEGNKGIEARETAYSGGRLRVDLNLRRVVFDGLSIARAYAEHLRSSAPDNRRRLPNEVYRTWESPPTAGQASFWLDPTQLIFCRGKNVVVLTSVTNNEKELEARRQLLQQVAPRLDAILAAEN